MPIRVGDRAEHHFVVEPADMEAFQKMSGDTSLIHTDREFARSRGFDDVIAYGGIMLAHLSHVLGMKIPGAGGTSLRWTIDYRRPLYVGAEADIDFEVTGVSAATGVIDGKFRIVSGGKTIATGSTQSMVPLDQIAE
ncbi:MAG: MaoC/PaaZ C-terminal domain-containing protein [Bacillota bacterium]